MRKIFIFLLICLLLICCISCDSANYQSKTFFAFDTIIIISYYGDATIMDDIYEIVANAEKKWSVTDQNSNISKLNTSGTTTLDELDYSILEKALYYSELTNGAFDISIYPIVKAWGFTTDKNRVPSQEEISNLLEKVDYHNITLTQNSVSLQNGMSIDLGGIAKGFIGDTILDYLQTHGISKALINLGGNVQTLGEKPGGKAWKVGINNPLENGILGTISVKDKCVVTSGSYERYFEENGVKYCHIINPKTGYPIDNGILSVSIIGDSGCSCDALSTAIFVMGLENGIEFIKSNKLDAIILTENGTIYITKSLENSFSIDSEFDGNIEVIND